MTKRSISVYQLFSALLICRIFYIITHVPVSGTVSITQTLINELIYGVLGIIIILPSILLNRIDGPVFNRVVSVAYALVLFVYLFCSYYEFDRLFTGVIFQGTSTIFIAVTMFLAVYYAVKMGLEAVMRTSTAIIAVFLISFLFIFFCSLGMINGMNIEYSLQWIDISEFYNRGCEYILFAVLIKYAKGNSLKAGTIFVASSAILSFGITILVTAVLGDYATVQSYPYFLLSSVSEFSIFKRMEAVHIMIYVFMTFVKLSVVLVTIYLLIHTVIPQKKHKGKIKLCVSVVGLAGSLIAAYIPPIYNIFLQTASNAWVVVAFSFLIPIIVLLLRGKQRHEK